MTFFQCMGRALLAWGIVLSIQYFDTEFPLTIGMMLIVIGSLLMDMDGEREEEVIEEEKQEENVHLETR